MDRVITEKEETESIQLPWSDCGKEFNDFFKAGGFPEEFREVATLAWDAGILSCFPLKTGGVL